MEAHGIKLEANLVISEDIKKSLIKNIESECQKSLELVIMNAIENVLQNTSTFEELVNFELKSYFREKIIESLKNNIKVEMLLDQYTRKVLMEIERTLKDGKNKNKAEQIK